MSTQDSISLGSEDSDTDHEDTIHDYMCDSVPGMNGEPRKNPGRRLKGLASYREIPPDTTPPSTPKSTASKPRKPRIGARPKFKSPTPPSSDIPPATRKMEDLLKGYGGAVARCATTEAPTDPKALETAVIQAAAAVVAHHEDKLRKTTHHATTAMERRMTEAETKSDGLSKQLQSQIDQAKVWQKAIEDKDKRIAEGSSRLATVVAQNGALKRKMADKAKAVEECKARKERALKARRLD